MDGKRYLLSRMYFGCPVKKGGNLLQVWKKFFFQGLLLIIGNGER